MWENSWKNFFNSQKKNKFALFIYVRDMYDVRIDTIFVQYESLQIISFYTENTINLWHVTEFPNELLLKSRQLSTYLLSIHFLSLANFSYQILWINKLEIFFNENFYASDRGEKLQWVRCHSVQARRTKLLGLGLSRARMFWYLIGKILCRLKIYLKIESKFIYCYFFPKNFMSL